MQRVPNSHTLEMNCSLGGGAVVTVHPTRVEICATFWHKIWLCSACALKFESDGHLFIEEISRELSIYALA